MTFGTRLDKGVIMKNIIRLWMAGFFLLVSSNLAFSQGIKSSQGSWPSFVDFHQLTNKTFKSPPANKKPQPKKNKQ